MNRTEKYILDRALIELENAVHELTSYARERQFIDMFDDPVKQIESFFYTRSNYDKRRTD